MLCAGALNASLLDFLGGGCLNGKSLRVGRFGLRSALFRGILDRLFLSLLGYILSRNLLSCNIRDRRLVGGRCSHATGQCHGCVRLIGLVCNLNGLVNPLGHGGEYIRVQGVEATLSLNGHGDHICIAKDFQVLRNGRLAHAQLLNHCTHRVGLLSENTHNSAASRIRDDRKNIRMHIAIMTYKVAPQA